MLDFQSPLTLLAAAICLVLSLILPWLVWRSIFAQNTKPRSPKILFAVYGWFALASLLAATGTLQFGPLPPPMFILVFCTLSLTLWLGLTPRLSAVLQTAPRQQIILLQSFRLPVEIFLWLLFLEGVLPIQMSFEGRNWDILTALTAPLIVWACRRWPEHRAQKLVVLWNFAGLALLFNIVAISILSTPVPFRVFLNEPANTFITHFPFVLLPVALVSTALLLHIWSLRQWLGAQETESTAFRNVC